uniref:uncharacterized protein LOC105350761 n=1 Tax=Fragaria vesca subsp. vesca TaxID=101020 RepID=UPI0005CB7251|nr:PREDICTED: uncharacterized protein LOC105350761 [Fragaria vesca subsp. vesca]
MQRSSPALVRQILRQNRMSNVQMVPALSSVAPPPPPGPPCDVFINHRGIDTKRTVAGLLNYHLSSRLNLRPFLDSKNMKPGDRLFDKIDAAIRKCKLGIAVFSPQYCESYFCLHELALLMESKKRVIPVFCNVKPSQLRVKDNGVCPQYEIERFSWALEEAKYTVGLTFDSSKADWSEFLREASDAVIQNLLELEGEQAYLQEKCQQ